MADVHPFGAYLVTAMEAADLTIADLKRMTGISDSLISRWRTGAVVPSMENLRLLAPALRVPPRDLFVVAGHTLPEEVGLTEIPAPPEPISSLYDEILSDPRLDKDMAEAFVRILKGLREEDSPRTHERKRRGA